MTLIDLYPRFQGHDIFQHEIIRKCYKIELYLQWQTDRKSYRLLPFALNDYLTQISRARHYSTLNISETVQDRDRYNELLLNDVIFSDMHH